MDGLHGWMDVIIVLHEAVDGWMDEGMDWISLVPFTGVWIFRCNCLTYPSILAAIHLPALHVRIYQMINRSCEIIHPYAILI